MSNKELAVVTISEATNNLLKEQLKEILQDRVKVKGYQINEIGSNTINSDLVLATNSLQGEIDNYITGVDDIIFARRSLDFSSLEMLIKLPDGKEVLLVNNTEMAAYETKSMLEKVGIDHINLQPFYPEKKLNKEIDLAITPGEKGYVPDTVEDIIDIGSRVLSLTTIIEALIKLDLLDEKADLLVTKHIKQLVKLSNRLYGNTKKVERINQMLEAVINHVHDGVIYINQQEEIEIFNQKAEEIFEMKAKEAVGAKVEEKISNTKLNSILKTEDKHLNDLQDIVEKKIVTSRVPVKLDNEVIGALATFKDVTEVKKLEKNLRRKLKDKGHIAKYEFSNIVGNSTQINQTIKKAKDLAESESTILIQGESGTGKELFAQSIHNYSNREKQPFVAVNCAALPENLLESELFGYEEGAFTGAKKGGRPGVFEQAHTGTIFLDEVGDIPLKIQTNLLRVLQEEEVMRIGGTKVIPINIRVIAATNKNLRKLVKEGKFREDLYYRLSVLPLKVPALRKRKEDIPLLIEFFLQKFNAGDLVFSERVKSRLYNYNWPGNIRELENCIEYISQTCNERVEIGDLPSHFHDEDNILRKSIEDIDCEIEDIKSELEELGDIKEYLFILNELHLAKQEGRNIGRREIAKNAKINNLHLSSHMVRSRLRKLESCRLVNIGQGRQGTKITEKGIEFLERTT
ncbi:sigma 54-interacting transcriptional regulator [Acetohalobium arabaticum]|uniref:Putative sigma54 specific transcriptional regulator n=1 Tax=Acetohalobium arabaticum (strain ATCC 49924 / DSM 5501 / Z-7288) TaxID=574087 RepID=D9QV00_ACEAZ|nr:sigma 54-interacting transcriptional regulator [Acetohalobium arabaticum]ADL12059.1 putative sigma54 specific transcriptional regulator [Acetohalobium arabaticum DSM 5501]